MRLSTIAIAVVVLASFADTFSQFPVVAPFARGLGADPALVGITVAVYSATNLGGNVVAGYLMDRFGRKRLLTLGLLAAAGALLLYTAVRTAGELVAVRATHGLAAAVLAPAAFTLLGDLFPKERRGRAMGANGALVAVAAMVAPAVSGIVRDRFGFDAVFLGVAGLLATTALLVHLLIVETYRPPRGELPPAGAPLLLLRRRAMVLPCVAAVALTYGLGTVVTYLPLRLEDLGYRSAQTGSAFSAFAVVALAVMASPLSRSRAGAGRVGRMALGLALAGLGLLSLAASPTLEAVLGAMGLFGLGFGLIFPAVNALVADASRPGERGTAFGLFYAFYSAGVVTGAGLAGLLAAGLAAGPPLAAGLVGLAGAAAVWLGGRGWDAPASTPGIPRREPG